MSKRKIMSRWGDPDLDDNQYVTLPGFVLRNYHKFTHQGKQVGLTADEFQVFVHIMAFKFDVEGAEAAPSLQTVATMSGKHVSSIRRTIKHLVEKGAAKVERRPGRPSVYDFGELVRQCRQFEALTRASTSADATPSVHASTSVDASTTPSVDASTPLACTLGEDLEGNEEYKTEKYSEPVGSDGAKAKPPRKRSASQLALDGMINAIADAFGLEHDKVTGTQWNEFRKSGRDLLEAGAQSSDMGPLHTWCSRQGWSNFTSVAMAKNYANYAKERQRLVNKGETKTATRAQSTRAALYGGES